MRKAQLAATATKTSRRPTGPAHADSPAPNMIEMKRRASSISTLSHLFHPTDEKAKQCNKCHVKFSPRWWAAEIVGPDEDKLLCHKCHWTAVRGTGNGEGLSEPGKDIDGNRDGMRDSLQNGMDRIQDPRVEIRV